MNIFLILYFVAGFFTCVYSNAISAVSDVNLCPPPENISPCTCFKVAGTNRVRAQCSNFKNAGDLKAIFDRNPRWKLHEVFIDNSAMSYLPADMFEKARFQSLNITLTTLLTLFDRTPETTPELKVYMTDVNILRSFSWSSIANANLLEIMATNMKIKSFGQEFKDNFPKGVQKISFENTGLISIRNQAFSELKNLKILVLKGGNLKKLSRDMFPNPWFVIYLDLSKQKIADLPAGFFSGMPNISLFLFEGNMLTTISDKVFTKLNVLYGFKDNPINCNCNVKWVVENIKPQYLLGDCTEPKSLKGKPLAELKIETFGYCQ